MADCEFCGNEISSEREIDGHEYCSQDCAYHDFMKTACSDDDLKDLNKEIQIT